MKVNIRMFSSFIANSSRIPRNGIESDHEYYKYMIENENDPKVMELISINRDDEFNKRLDNLSSYIKMTWKLPRSNAKLYKFMEVNKELTEIKSKILNTIDEIVDDYVSKRCNSKNSEDDLLELFELYSIDEIRSSMDKLVRSKSGWNELLDYIRTNGNFPDCSLSFKYVKYEPSDLMDLYNSIIKNNELYSCISKKLDKSDISIHEYCDELKSILTGIKFIKFNNFNEKALLLVSKVSLNKCYEIIKYLNDIGYNGFNEVIDEFYDSWIAFYSPYKINERFIYSSSIESTSFREFMDIFGNERKVIELKIKMINVIISHKLDEIKSLNDEIRSLEDEKMRLIKY